MSHPWHHALSSAKKFGGKPEDYLPLHKWFDASKQFMTDFRHRALRHHAQGIFEAERIFGETLTTTEGKVVPTRLVAEQHVREDCGGYIPSMQDWFIQIQPLPWMNRSKKLYNEFEQDSVPGSEASLPQSGETA